MYLLSRFTSVDTDQPLVERDIRMTRLDLRPIGNAVTTDGEDRFHGPARRVQAVERASGRKDTYLGKAIGWSRITKPTSRMSGKPAKSAKP